MCLAVLRRDGFISLDAGDMPGSVVTRRFTLPAGRLFVNVDSRGGEFRAELESEDGKPLARSRLVAADVSRQPLEWEAGDPAAFAGRRVALRFTLRNARIYSFWFSE